MMMGLVLYYNVNGDRIKHTKCIFCSTMCFILCLQRLLESLRTFFLCRVSMEYRKLVTFTVAGTPSPMAIVFIVYNLNWTWIYIYRYIMYIPWFLCVLRQSLSSNRSFGSIKAEVAHRKWSTKTQYNMHRLWTVGILLTLFLYSKYGMYKIILWIWAKSSFQVFKTWVMDIYYL